MEFQLWRRSGPDPSAAESLGLHLQSLNRILKDESQAPNPHLCIQNVATAQIYTLVSAIGSVPGNEQIINEVVRFFNLLIDSEEEGFLENASFADNLTGFIRAISSLEVSSPDSEAELGELLFAVAAKLRQEDEIPYAWFRPSLEEDYGDSTICQPSSSSRSREFPLVYLLLNYVHHEGRVGDFARTGLLYVLGSASRSERLERWFIESELATMMASGLGALYSQLSSKVVLSYSSDAAPPIIAFSDVPKSERHDGVDSIDSPDLQSHLRTFLLYLTFWQDVLEYCGSRDIRASLLDHFDFLFLRPLLYPSLVESSDVDGGSAVAVLTYIRHILNTISQRDIIQLILNYMLNAPSKLPSDVKSSRPSTLARRQKSESLIIARARTSSEASPDLLTLVNVLQGYLQSPNQQTITASLRLLSTILISCHEYTILNIFKVVPTDNHSLGRTALVHQEYTDTLFALAESILDDDGLEASYEAHLQDAETAVEAHPCSNALLSLPTIDSSGKICPYTRAKSSGVKDIASDDTLIVSLMHLFEDFLTNDIEANLGLTQTFAAMAVCKDLRLESWLLGDTTHPPSIEERSLSLGGQHILTISPSQQESPEYIKEESDQARKRLETLSSLFVHLGSLVERVSKLREDVEDFDIHLAERRHVFKMGEQIDNAVSDSPEPQRKSQDSTEGNRLKPITKMGIGSLTERLKTSSDVSRSTSPRGRRSEHTQRNFPPPSSLAGRLSHLRLSPSPSSTKSMNRGTSSSPSRKESISSTASPVIPSPRGPPDVLHRKVRLKSNKRQQGIRLASGGSGTSSARSRSIDPDSRPTEEETKEISLSCILTNVIILQEFILELVAIMQVRANLFGEVTFD